MASVLAPDPAVERSSTSYDTLYEIIHGERVELPPMSILSNSVAGELFVELTLQLRTQRLGRATMEGLFILDGDENTRRRPDVAFVSAERWPLDRPIPETGDWNVVPDLAVEVASPNDIFSDVVSKMAGELGPCSAWPSKSTAHSSASTVSSAPAMSIATTIAG